MSIKMRLQDTGSNFESNVQRNLKMALDRE